MKIFIQVIRSRKSQHKSNCNNPNDKEYNQKQVEYSKEYRENNKEHLIEYSRKYHENDKEKISEKTKKK